MVMCVKNDTGERKIIKSLLMFFAFLSSAQPASSVQIDDSGNLVHEDSR